MVRTGHSETLPPVPNVGVDEDLMIRSGFRERTAGYLVRRDSAIRTIASMSLCCSTLRLVALVFCLTSVTWSETVVVDPGVADVDHGVVRDYDAATRRIRMVPPPGRAMPVRAVVQSSALRSRGLRW